MTRQPAPEGWVGLISAIVADTPSLPGAACAGRSELFDPRGDGEPWETTQRRQEAARRICEWTHTYLIPHAVAFTLADRIADTLTLQETRHV